MKEITQIAQQQRQVKKALSQAYREGNLDEARLLELDRAQFQQMLNRMNPKPAATHMPAWLIGR